MYASNLMLQHFNCGISMLRFCISSVPLVVWEHMLPTHVFKSVSSFSVYSAAFFICLFSSSTSVKRTFRDAISVNKSRSLSIFILAEALQRWPKHSLCPVWKPVFSHCSLRGIHFFGVQSGFLEFSILSVHKVLKSQNSHIYKTSNRATKNTSFTLLCTAPLKYYRNCNGLRENKQSCRRSPWKTNIPTNWWRNCSTAESLDRPSAKISHMVLSRSFFLAGEDERINAS